MTGKPIALLVLPFCATWVQARESDNTPGRVEAAPPPQAAELVRRALDFLQPEKPGESPVRSFRLRGTVPAATGGLAKGQGCRFHLVLQPPRHLRLEIGLRDFQLTAIQNGSTLHFTLPEKKWTLTARPDVPRFTGVPESVSPVVLSPMELPVSRARLALLPALISTVSGTAADGRPTLTFSGTPAAAALKLSAPGASLTATLSADGSGVPEEIVWQDGGNSLTLRVEAAETGGELPAETWVPPGGTGGGLPGTGTGGESGVPLAEGWREESASTAHIDRAVRVLVSAIGSRIPSLPPSTGERWLVATEGRGRLEDHDGTRVLFLAGTPEEMGRQHGTLMKKDVRRLVDRILYGVGVGSSLGKGRWFFGEIEEAVRRTGPFVEPDHLVEMDALAAAAGLESREVRLANFFPELFHCSGFALLGKSTRGGRIFHGRILDYLRGAGLEENAVVMVSRPDEGHAWVNVGYAGFTGSVTAMNEKHLSIGEMGGRGEGDWDGKPMAQLVREVMEKCATLEEAVDFMRRTPRTCEYYYVLADAKSGRAAGIKATPLVFEVVETGKAHPQLPDPVEDTVLLSAGSRYEELVKRVKAGFGKFDAPAALDLMTPPVCMTSNIHSVLFAPDTLDFWVANADSEKVASETRYTAYNLARLLQDPPAAPRP